MNKRGLDSDTVIKLIIYLLVAALLIWFITGGFKTVQSWFRAQTATTTSPVFIESCKQKCSLEQKQDYCCTRKEISFAETGTKSWITCSDSRIESGSACTTISCAGVCSVLSCKDQGGQFLVTCTGATPNQITDFKVVDTTKRDAAKACASSENGGILKETCDTNLEDAVSASDVNIADTVKTNNACCVPKDTLVCCI